MALDRIPFTGPATGIAVTMTGRNSAHEASSARSPHPPGAAGKPDLRREVRALLVIAAPLAAA